MTKAGAVCLKLKGQSWKQTQLLNIIGKHFPPWKNLWENLIRIFEPLVKSDLCPLVKTSSNP